MVFSIYYQNVRGLRTKTIQFKRNLQLNNYDVVVLNETWLLDGIKSEELFGDVYCVWRRDRDYAEREQSRGGGVLIAVRRRLAARVRPEWHSTAEDIWVTIVLRSGGANPSLNLHIGCLYLCNQNQGLSFASQLVNFSNKVLSISAGNPNDKILLLGDFNLSDIVWSQLNYSRSLRPVFNRANCNHVELIDLINLCNLYQYNYIRNCFGTILDLILCNDEVSVSRCPDSLVLEDNYHPALICKPHFVQNTSLSPGPRLKYLYDKGDYLAISNELNENDWQLLLSCGSVDEAVNTFNSTLKILRDKYILFKYVHDNKYPVWYTPALRNILKEKNKFHRKTRVYHNKADNNSFKLLRERARKVEQECYNNYIDKVERSIRNNPKVFWSYVQDNALNNSYPSTMLYKNKDVASGSSICNAFADFFNSNYLPSVTPAASPPILSVVPSSASDICTIEIAETKIFELLRTLDYNKSAGPDDVHPRLLINCASSLVTPICILFKRSISEGIMPKIWKTGTITPIHKKGSKREICNYRPISKLCVLAKIFEKIIHNQVYDAVKNSFIPQQHGFLKGRSTTSNLITFTDAITKGMDAGGQVDAIYTDYSKAFDRIDHGVLLDKLLAAGIQGDLHRWFTSYVNNRCQTVVLNGFASISSPIPSGVPQGSILGPLLFVLFINDVGKCFYHSDFLLFADDMKIFKVINSNDDFDLLQQDLNRFRSYCASNKLDLNVTKCSCITFSRSPTPLQYVYKINDQVLTRTNSVIDLGITIDSKLLFDEHIEKIVAKALKSLGFLFRITRDFKTIKTLKILYCSLVRSNLEYASQVWNPCYEIYIERLERIQKKFLSFINFKHKIPSLDYVQNCKRHHLLPLAKRREAADLTFLHNILLNVVDSPDLLSLIKLKTPLRAFSRRNFLRIHTPDCSTNYRKNSYLVRVANVFNSVYSPNSDLFTMRQNEFKLIVNKLLFT